MSDREAPVTDQALARSWWIWLALTGVFVVSNAALLALAGPPAFGRLIQRGPLSSTPLTLAAVGMVWAALGAALGLLRDRAFRARHGLAVLSALGIVLLYANVLRERTQYGDLSDYLAAAHDLVGGAPLHGRYVYPPFLATVLAPLLPLGDGAVGVLMWAGNLLALALFVVLLRATLVRYGFGAGPATLATVLFAAVNVPILRTLGYVQVNLHVTNLILLALLAHPRVPLLSALALGAAVHLKASPAVLALPFLLVRDLRWLAGFAVALAGIALATAIPFGWGPFADFLDNARAIYLANPIAFRENSVDSLYRSALSLARLPLGLAWAPILVTKVVLAVWALRIMARTLRHRTFSGGGPAAPVLDGLPPLLVLMLLASPLLWEHHPVFVALPYLLMLRRIDTPREIALYGLAYTLEFLLPTFDFFPWSFGRLLSPILLLALMDATAARPQDGRLWPSLRAPAAARRQAGTGKPTLRAAPGAPA
jgi:hypothetical protein